MEGILRNTFGVLVYQEQIMQLAQTLAGYSLGEADVMRRAMGKKKREAMAKEEKKFLAGAAANGIEPKKAVEIFNLMSQFADYGFNRSHSIAYAYVAFQTAYLKAHQPAHFYSAVLSHEADDSAKVYKYSNELRSMGLSLLPPDVNESGEGFTPAGDAVRFGLSAIKGIGTSTVRAIIDARTDGKFSSVTDFVSRVDSTVLGKRGMESLNSAGAFDSVKPASLEASKWRAMVHGGLDAALSVSQKAMNDRINGQSGLFGIETVSDQGDMGLLPDTPAWTAAEIANHEKSSIGFFLSAHPLDAYQEILAGLNIDNIADHESIKAGDHIVLAGVVSAMQVRYSKKGNQFATFRLEDRSSGVKCLVWSEAFKRLSGLIVNDDSIIVEGRVEAAEGQDITIVVAEARSLAEALPSNARSVRIDLPAEKASDDDFLYAVFDRMSKDTGRCEVELAVTTRGIRSIIETNGVRISGSRRIEKDLQERGCGVSWQM